MAIKVHLNTLLDISNAGIISLYIKLFQCFDSNSKKFLIKYNEVRNEVNNLFKKN